MDSVLFALAETAGVDAPPAVVSGRVKEEGAGASPTTERRPGTTLTPGGAAVCNNRKTENTTDAIHPPGKPEDSHSMVTNPAPFSTFS
jgi:hypothetical protein